MGRPFRRAHDLPRNLLHGYMIYSCLHSGMLGLYSSLIFSMYGSMVIMLCPRSCMHSTASELNP